MRGEATGDSSGILLELEDVNALLRAPPREDGSEVLLGAHQISPEEVRHAEPEAPCLLPLHLVEASEDDLAPAI